MTTHPAGPPAPPDELVVSSFGVRHGDCTLVEYLQAGVVRFRLLCDAGVAAPRALFAHLDTVPHARGRGFVDLVVLTHVDHDHQGGLPAVFQSPQVTVGEYWGPCLPAFRRLRWLFQARVFDAIDRADALERDIRAAGVGVLYPLEGHATATPDRRVTVSVLSPAARLVRELLYGSEAAIRRLLTQAPLPLEWLITGEELDGTQPDQAALRGAFATRSHLAPEDLPDPLPELRLGADAPAALAAQCAAGGGIAAEPDFFGNHVLNDTSLVLVIDVLLDGRRRRRVLLTGDQENWSYIAARHPAGLGVDLLKVPHHGGRVFLADREEESAIEQMVLWLRPRVAMVSAMGQHRLPHVRTREALRQAGATLMCPNTRGFEPLSPQAVLSDSPCCFDAYGCRHRTLQQAEVVTVRLSGDGASASQPACLQGTLHAGPAPIIVHTQRIVEPDETFVRWTRHEVERLAGWIRERLRERHREFSQRMDESASPHALALGHVGVRWSELETLARAEQIWHLAADPEPVLRYAVANGLILRTAPYGYASREAEHYLPPTQAALDRLHRWLRTIPHLIFTLPDCDETMVRSGNRHALLQACNTEMLAMVGAFLLRMPLAFVVEAVMPKVVVDLAQACSARVCRASWPSDAFRHRSDAVLHLYRADADPVPDVFGPGWLAPFWNAPDDAARLAFVMGGAGKDMAVIGLHADRSRKDERDALAGFMRDEAHTYRSVEFRPGLFPKRFAEAAWTPAWERRRG